MSCSPVKVSKSVPAPDQNAASMQDDAGKNKGKTQVSVSREEQFAGYGHATLDSRVQASTKVSVSVTTQPVRSISRAEATALFARAPEAGPSSLEAFEGFKGSIKGVATAAAQAGARVAVSAKAEAGRTGQKTKQVG